MAVSDTQKVDLLYKQSLRVARTDGAKDPTGESIVSTLIVRGDKVWINASSIPSTPSAVAGIVQAYIGNAGAIQCTGDITTTPVGGGYSAWLTSLTNWIPPEFGSQYSVGVYVDTTGSTTPTTTGTQIFAAGSGGTGEYYFDYSAGVLNFIGGTIPAILNAGKSIFIVGYRYVGGVGLNSNVALGNTTVTGFINVSSTANIGGDLTARSNVTVNGAVLIANTLAVGNTETTGYINVSSTANIGGVVSARANVTVNGALVVSNTAALGNTTVTGFINVSSTSNLRGDAVVNGALTVANTVALGNTTVTGFINVSSTANIGGDVNLRGNVVVNGAVTIANTISHGNTEVTGYINVSSTANIGGVVSARANVVVNGAFTVVNTAALGNTTVTGFINVSSTANVGGDVSLRGNVVANGTLLVSNAASFGNTTVSGYSNTTTLSRVGTVRTTQSFNPSSNVATSTDTITITGHGFVNNDVVKYTVAAGNTALTNLTSGLLYYVRDADPNTFKLSLTQSGTAIDLTAGVNEVGHSFVSSETVITPWSVLVGNSTSYAAVNSSTISTSGNGSFGGNVIITGNLTVFGTSVSVTAANFTTSDNLLYLNEARQATVTNASSNGTHFLYTANNTFVAGMVVDVSSMNPAGYNILANAATTITLANVTHFAVANTSSPGAFVSGGTAKARISINPDLGFTGEYNDGTFHHAGFFRDATDGVWKVFDNYAPEPGAAVNIDTANVSFHIADFQANTITANTINTGNTTISGVINVSSTANVGGAITARSNVTVNGALTVANTAALGNTTISGSLIANNTTIAGSANVIGTPTTFNANTGVNGTTEFVTSIGAHGFSNGDYVQYITSTGNTAVSGLANAGYYYVTNANTSAFTLSATYGGANVNLTAGTISETGHTLTPIRVMLGTDGSIATSVGLANVASLRVLGGATVNGTVTVANTISTGNASVTGFINVSTTANIGGVLTARANVAVNGAFVVANTADVGNTTVTGFINVSTTANVGGDITARSNVTVNGALSVVNTVALGNTTVTGFINVSTTANVGGIANFRDNVIANGTLTVANTIATGNATVTGFINVSTTANVGGQINARANVTVNGAVLIANTLATGNTDVTGYINVSSTANIGGILNARANVAVNGALIVSNTADLGNTSVTGFINVSSSANIGGVVTARANVTVNGALVVANTATLGNTTIIGSLVANNTTIGGYANVIGTPAAFNANTGVNGTTDFITTTSAHGFSNGDYVQYTVAAGNTSLAALTNNGYYYITNANTTAFILSSSYNGANLDIIPTATSEVGHTFTPIRVVLGTDGSITSTTGIANVATLRVLGTATVNGAVTAGNTSVTGFINVSSTANVGGAATLRGDVTVNGALVVSNTASLGNTTVTGFINVHGTAATFNANTGVTNATEFITTVGAHGFANGDIVRYIVSAGNTALSGLANATTYYVVNANTTAFNLSTSYGGSAINVTAGTVSETGHTFTSIRVAVGQDGSITSTTGVANVASLRVLGNAVINGTATVGANITLGTTTISANGGVGTNGQFLTSGASGNVYWSTAITSAGGSNTQVQFNNNGSFGACSAFTFDTSSNTLTTSIISARDMTLTGNLSVNGTLTYINTTNLNIGDNIITLNADVTGVTAPTENAGIEVNRGNAANVSWFWDESNDRWTAGNTYVDIFRASNTTIVGTLTANAVVGSAGQVLTSGAAGNIYWSTVTTTPGGSNSQVAFNDSGAWGFDAGMTYNKTTDTLSLLGALGVGANVTANTSAVVVGSSKIESTALTLGGTVSANGGNGSAGQVLISGNTGNVYWGAGGASVTVGDTAPASPFVNSLWWDSSTGVLRIYYNDGDTSQWVDSVPQISTLQAVTAGGNSTTIAVGLANTTITGFANVVGTLQVSANVTLGTTAIAANGGVGSAGQVLTSGASGNVYWSTVTTTPSGSNTQVQFNDSGVYGGSTGFVFNKSSNTLTIANTVVTNNLTANGLVTANGATGTVGQVLVSGGGSANVYWGAAVATASGTNTQIQFNDGGTALGGDAGLTYNKTTDTMTVLGGVNTNGSISIAGAGRLNLGANAAASYATANAYIQYNSSNNSIDFVIA